LHGNGPLAGRFHANRARHFPGGIHRFVPLDSPEGLKRGLQGDFFWDFMENSDHAAGGPYIVFRRVEFINMFHIADAG
jgi:hypothetical protein